MTSEDLKSELEKQPFAPIRLHLVSGNTIVIKDPGNATMLRHSVLITHEFDPKFVEAGYDKIALRNIERIEQIRTPVIWKR